MAGYFMLAIPESEPYTFNSVESCIIILVNNIEIGAASHAVRMYKSMVTV